MKLLSVKIILPPKGHISRVATEWKFKISPSSKLFLFSNYWNSIFSHSFWFPHKRTFETLFFLFAFLWNYSSYLITLQPPPLINSHKRPFPLKVVERKEKKIFISSVGLLPFGYYEALWWECIYGTPLPLPSRGMKIKNVTHVLFVHL